MIFVKVKLREDLFPALVGTSGYANDEDNKRRPYYICVLVFASLLHTHIGTNWTLCPIKEKVLYDHKINLFGG